ncbi:ABC transporter permease [Williamsia sp. 1138]|nr:ABC transporter permease [Williamsia sp. 1138]
MCSTTRVDTSIESSGPAPTTDAGGLRNAKVLIGFARPHRRSILLGLALALSGSVTVLATPMVTKWILDSLGTGASMQGPVWVLIALLVVGAILGWAQWVVLGTTAEHIVFDARGSLVKRLLGSTVPSVQSRPVGELVTRVTSDTVLLREAASTAAVGVVNATCVTIGTVVLMGVLDLMLLGVTLAAIIIVGAIFTVLMPRIAKAEALTQESLGHLGGVLEGSLRSVRTVKAAGAEDRIGALIGTSAMQARLHAIAGVRISAGAWTVAWTGVQGAIIAILALGAWRVDSGTLEVSALIAFLLYAFTLMGPVGELTANVTALQSGIAAAMRIRELETLEAEFSAVKAVDSHMLSTVTETASIEFDDVTVRYGGDFDAALDRVTLQVPAVGHTAIVGPSGAGKTSLFSAVLRFVEPEAGVVRLNGVPYPDLGVDEVRARISYVEQESPLVPGTVGENLRFIHPDATDTELAEVLSLLQLDEVVAAQAKGLDTPIRDTDLSGGQRQRIAMARAMIRPSPILLLDEATSQVDTLTEAAIVASIRHRATSGAVLTIAHRLSTVRHADTIVVMESGRVRATGDHEQLMKNDELYRRMVHAGGFDVPAEQLDEVAR